MLLPRPWRGAATLCEEPSAARAVPTARVAAKEGPGERSGLDCLAVYLGVRRAALCPAPPLISL